MDPKIPISLVIPVRNEEDSIENLLESIDRQTLQPDEIVFVDGGSADGTVAAIERAIGTNHRIRLIKTDGATPGKGRNIGIAAAINEWIALTDAGITLDREWLECLSREAVSDPSTDIVYGNYAPSGDRLFDRCAATAYVSPQGPTGIRGRFIASCLLRKRVWEEIGGFPDLRAAEDLIFMEAAENLGYRKAHAPRALVRWQLQPGFGSTYRKFVLYSKHNVWAGRQWDWHYGVLRQYVLLAPFILLSVIHSLWWLLIVPVWLLMRAVKRILAHRFEYGLGVLLNPAFACGVMMLITVVDFATFVGWIQAKFGRE